MTGPIVGRGQLIGTIHFARVDDTPAFSTSDLTSLSAVCTHVSACLATLRVQAPVAPGLMGKQLTPREMQIAQLVAQGSYR
jgi:hypothetical protein